MALPTITQEMNTLLTTTLFVYMQKKVVDQIFKGSVLLQQLQQKGCLKAQRGGESLRIPLNIGSSPVFSINYRESFPLTPTDTLTVAQYGWRWVVAPLVVYDGELAMNQGEARLLNLMEEKMRNVETSLRETINAMLYLDGSGNGGRDLLGLSVLIDDTAPVGGLNPADPQLSFWKSYVDRPTNPTPITFDDISFAISRTTWDSSPNLIITTVDLWTKLHNLLPPNIRYIDVDIARWGFSNFVIRGNIPVVFDRYCPDRTMFIINTEHLCLVYHPDYYFTPLGFQRVPNALAQANTFVFMGNMVVDSRRHHGKLLNRTT